MLIIRLLPTSHNSEMFTKTVSCPVTKNLFISSFFSPDLTGLLNVYSFIDQDYFWLFIVNFAHYGVISNSKFFK